jgi:hypothetical protein
MKSWDRSVNGFCQDLNSMCALVADDATDLYARIPRRGQTILRAKLCSPPTTMPTTWGAGVAAENPGSVVGVILRHCQANFVALDHVFLAQAHGYGFDDLLRALPRWSGRSSDEDHAIGSRAAISRYFSQVGVEGILLPARIGLRPCRTARWRDRCGARRAEADLE